MDEKKTSLVRLACAMLLALVVACGIVALPGSAWADDEQTGEQKDEQAVEQENEYYAMAAPIDLDDGTYQVEVALEGGTGKASVVSPTLMAVQDGRAAVRIEWSSPNYDYMIVGDKEFQPVNEDGNSVFAVPITAYDEPVQVVADTTAMSEPHEIEYMLTFDSGSIEPFEQQSASQGFSPVWAIAILVVVVGGFLLGSTVGKRRKKSR